MSEAKFGWDLVLRSVRSDLSSPEDVLVAFVHWRLLGRGLGAVGTGEHFTALEDNAPSELMPEQWNVQVRMRSNN